MMDDASEKPIRWMGSSYRDLANFPTEARKSGGYNLNRVQHGLMPLDWKPMETIGPGTYEVRITTGAGASIEHRIFFVAKFDEAVYVLHAFGKKTQQTSRHDIELGRSRYAAMLRRRSDELRERNRR